ncbi:SapC family protein [Martelella sp. HB161492]|uniref:SapC family protein n=1 Tax=Martelella sp. HB161492 TaxID=2720726 RepID=UPI00159246BD|nr:SapC family protein [Martelella sp. HB161492]
MTDNALPLFYRTPEALRFEDHRDLCLERRDDFSFARHTNAIPLPPSEFLPASRDYPIVFARGSDMPSPVAVTGFRARQNLFVTEQGHWKSGTYIPAYVRRYPFIIIQSQDQSHSVLGFDSSCNRIKATAQADDPIPLFEKDGAASPGAKQAIDFCHNFHRSSLLGNELVKELTAHDLLVEKSAEMTLVDKQRFRLDGFLVVDADRFRALPEDVVAAWHKKGFTDAVVLHLASAQNWQRLVELDILENGSAAA